MTDKKYIYLIQNWKVNPFSLTISHKEKGDFKVQNKVFKVLMVLLEANGEVVHKEELYKKVWEDIYVTDNSLNKAVSELRKIFNDNAVHPRYIETIPKVGYRFIGKIRKEESAKKPLGIKKNNYTFILLFTALLFSSILLFYYLNFFLKNEPVLAKVSPSGKKIAIIKKDDSGLGIFIHNINSKKKEKIINIKVPDSYALSWGPKNQRLVFNQTQKEETFYAIDVLDIKTKKITYIKFAKDSLKHQSESLPEKHDKPISYVKNQKLSAGNTDIDHIYLTQFDTIKVLFQDKRIIDFNW